MFRWYLTGRVGLVDMPLRAPDDAGGAAPDGAADAGDAGAGEGGDDGSDAGVDDGGQSAGAREGDAGGDDEADDDDDDFSEVSFKEDPQFKRVLAKLKKRNRQLAKLRPVASRVKDVNLDDVLAKARTADEMRDVLARHPDLATEVLKAISGMRKTGADAPAKKPFNRADLPFSVEDDSGKFFADFYERFMAMEEELQATKKELSGYRNEGQQEKAVAERRTWKGAVQAAASKVPEWARDMFNDAVYGAYAEAQRRGTVLDPQRVIGHYLSKLPIGDKAKAAARAAASQRIAGANSNLPRVPSTPGMPAGARKKGETVADVNRRVRAGGGFAR